MRVWPTLSSAVSVTLIVTLWPAWRVPDACDREMPDGSETDQLTGPPFAVSVNEALLPRESRMLDVDTLSVPAVGEGDEPEPPEPEPLDPEPPDDPDPDPEEPAPDPDEPPDDEDPPDETGTEDVPRVGSADGADAGDGVPDGFACVGVWLE